MYFLLYMKFLIRPLDKKYLLRSARKSLDVFFSDTITVVFVGLQCEYGNQLRYPFPRTLFLTHRDKKILKGIQENSMRL